VRTTYHIAIANDLPTIINAIALFQAGETRAGKVRDQEIKIVHCPVVVEKALLWQACYTQEEIAKNVGVPKETIPTWEMNFLKNSQRIIQEIGSILRF
jgi:DNA-binding XRE family transcriptional regulator